MDTPIADLSFEDALKRLEEIVHKLETGEAKLGEALDLYEEGTRLRQQCSARLDAAQARIEAIRLGPDGRPAGVAPFDGG
ncbi:exodeoxyribonuclease VII small subunit [Sphingomonas panacisoli]|uniref:Exodeoxyribonuclease 7 small subunit n=1 Tax=Sphingomonas panacisoli TaxID=1813879 RepID=A0A5B8LK14_9SPHN|nr:exodeoxyribonuclease VII small subunit [Sphingomonas panacisoli]QDZ08471.1 exodeoxyribonuclease VII small subunit [Sphingomonas panacisoli]